MQLARTIRALAETLDCETRELLPLSQGASLSHVMKAWQQHRRSLGEPAGHCLLVQPTSGAQQELQELGFHTEVLAVPMVAEEEWSNWTPASALRTALQRRSNDTSPDLVVVDAPPAGLPPLLPGFDVEAAQELRQVASQRALLLLRGVDQVQGGDHGLANSGADLVELNLGGWMGGLEGSKIAWVAEEHHGWLPADAHETFFGSCASDEAAVLRLLSLDAMLSFWKEIGLETAQAYVASLAEEANERLAEALGVPGRRLRQDLLGSAVLLPLVKALPEEPMGELVKAVEGTQQRFLHVGLRMHNGAKDVAVLEKLMTGAAASL